MSYTKRFFELFIEVSDEVSSFTLQQKIDITLSLLEEENKDNRMQMIANEKELKWIKERKNKAIELHNKIKLITDPQKKTLTSLGVTNVDNMTREEASNKIAEILARRKK